VCRGRRRAGRTQGRNDNHDSIVSDLASLIEHVEASIALAKMQGKKCGLVIFGGNMEPMTGYDLLREVRASPELSQIPFIMITAESKTENVIAAKKAGVSNGGPHVYV
jgi:PleD family two-component response regulator